MVEHTSCYHTVDKRFSAFEKILAHDFLPVIAVKNELVFEEIDIGSLVPSRTLARVVVSSPYRGLYRRSPK